MPSAADSDIVCRSLGRFAVTPAVGTGGMASVFIAREVGAEDAPLLALKLMHEHLATNPEYRGMFLDEARLAQTIRHPNVVSTIEIDAKAQAPYIVMEYVHGESLAFLLSKCWRKGLSVPVGVVVHVLVDALRGLDAAHDARSDDGRHLGLVHRDVSPHNILVGVDGKSRIVDFGIAKAAGRIQQTRQGQMKGKLNYMAPEQIRGNTVTPATDVFGAGVTLWECLAGEMLFAGDNDADVMFRVLEAEIRPPSALRPELDEALDAIAMRALEREPEARFSSARDMAASLERRAPIAEAGDVGAWVEEVASQRLDRKEAWMRSLRSFASQLRAEPLAVRTQMLTAPSLVGQPPSKAPDKARSAPASDTKPSASSSSPKLPSLDLGVQDGAEPSAAAPEFVGQARARAQPLSHVKRTMPVDSAPSPAATMRDTGAPVHEVELPELELDLPRDPPAVPRHIAAGLRAGAAAAREQEEEDFVSATEALAQPPAALAGGGPGIELPAHDLRSDDPTDEPFSFGPTDVAALSSSARPDASVDPASSKSASSKSASSKSGAASAGIAGAGGASHMTSNRATPTHAVPSRAVPTRRVALRAGPFDGQDALPWHTRVRPGVGLFVLGLAVSVIDVMITRSTGTALAMGPVKPSWVAATLAAAGVLYIVYVVMRPPPA